MTSRRSAHANALLGWLLLAFACAVTASVYLWRRHNHQQELAPPPVPVQAEIAAPVAPSATTPNLQPVEPAHEQNLPPVEIETD